jgi:hypothetical protein
MLAIHPIHALPAIKTLKSPSFCCVATDVLQLGIQDKVASAAGDFSDSPQEVTLPAMVSAANCDRFCDLDYESDYDGKLVLIFAMCHVCQSNGSPSLVAHIACGANHNLAVLRNEHEVRHCTVAHKAYPMHNRLCDMLSVDVFLGLRRHVGSGTRQRER